MHGHLVAVEVGVIGRADQRMQMYRLTLDQDRFEGLNAETMERRRAVEQHRMLLDHLFEDVPDFRTHPFDHALRALDVVREPAVDQLLHHERLEELERHLFGQAALMQLERRTDHDDRTSRIVDALAEQVLPEASLLAFENVGERLERTIVGAGDGTAAAAVVDQRVDRFLQHALFVLDDDLGRVELEQPLETVVAVDHAAVEIVEVGRRETAAVELHHRAELGGDDRHCRQHHPFRTVTAIEKCFDNLETLDRLEAFLSAGLLELFAEIFLDAAQVEVAQQLADRFGAHAGLEAIAELIARFAILLLREHLALGQRRVAGINHHVGREVDDLLQLTRRHVEQDADAAGHALEIPDVADRRGQLDVAHTLAAHFRAGDLDAAAIADHALEADALILAAVALPIFGRAEDLLAEKTVALGLERAVVNRLGFLDFTKRPGANLLRRREADAHGVEVVDVDEVQKDGLRLRPLRRRLRREGAAHVVT